RFFGLRAGGPRARGEVSAVAGPVAPGVCGRILAIELGGAGPRRGRGAAASLESVAGAVGARALVTGPRRGRPGARGAEPCPACARPLRAAHPHEGLFLRTMNQVVALGFWVPVIVLAIVFLAVAAGYLSTRW